LMPDKSLHCAPAVSYLSKVAKYVKVP
jgi:hypothetical protein